jgi:CO/xanthine dehydrogenase Mo-binding subunit
LGESTLERRRTPAARLDAAGVAGACRNRARAQFRDRRHRPQLFPLGLVAGAFCVWRRTVSGRDRCTCGAQRGGKFAALNRVSVKFPPTHHNQSGNVYTAACGTLVRVEIARATGALRIAKAYSVFECGQALVPEVLRGQAQGGFAMGVGYTLLETLPPYEGGPGNGQWNLGQYLVARGSDLPLRDLEIEMLPPLTPDEPPKGIAEVVMIPVVPAILNAIFDATRHRFQSLPVTQAMLKGAIA